MRAIKTEQEIEKLEKEGIEIHQAEDISGHQVRYYPFGKFNFSNVLIFEGNEGSSSEYWVRMRTKCFTISDIDVGPQDYNSATSIAMVRT